MSFTVRNTQAMKREEVVLRQLNFTEGENVSCPASHRRHPKATWIPAGRAWPDLGNLSCLILQEFTSGQLCCILNTVFADTEGSLLGILMFCVVCLTQLPFCPRGGGRSAQWTCGWLFFLKEALTCRLTSPFCDFCLFTGYKHCDKYLRLLLEREPLLQWA